MSVPPHGAARTPKPPRDMSHLRARRRQARRRQRLLRVDLGLGVLGAIVLLLATPGLAIAAIFALLLLLLCVLSIVIERRIAARRLRAGARSQSATPDRPGAPTRWLRG
jgi:hypothetical protein